MPTSIGPCPSCGNGMYLESGVPGACACEEGTLRTLLAQARQDRLSARTAPSPGTVVMARVNPGQPNRNGDVLPPLTAEMLLSATGRSEFHEAQGRRTASLSMGTMVERDPGLSPQEMRRVAGMNPDDPPDLDPSMWLPRDMQDGPYSLDPASQYIAEDRMPISFADDVPLEDRPRVTPSAGIEARRFRADHGPPRYEPFDSRMAPSGQDGRVVAQRTGRGFAPVEGVSRSEAVRADRAARTERAAVAMPTPSAPAPTAFDRIRKGGLDI